MDTELNNLAVAVGERLTDAGCLIATAESCTGGWVAQVVTAVAGSSGWFERGFVTYSNAAKREMLGVPARILDQHGAVSEAVAVAMVQGALDHSRAHVSLAITGIAGPGGGSETKPVGTVCFAWARRRIDTPRPLPHKLLHETRVFSGDRESVRRQAVIHSLQQVLALFETTG